MVRVLKHTSVGIFIVDAVGRKVENNPRLRWLQIITVIQHFISCCSYICNSVEMSSDYFFCLFCNFISQNKLRCYYVHRTF